LFPVFFPFETLKNLEFSQILLLVRFKKFSHILIKWIQRCYFYKGAEVFTQGPNFWIILAEIFLKRVGNTEEGWITTVFNHSGLLRLRHLSELNAQLIKKGVRSLQYSIMTESLMS
jgi:hypothetical protein